MASEIDVQPQLRLHRLSWVFALVGFIRQFILPLIAITFFRARDDGTLWGLVFVVPLLAAALWRQMSFRYGFGPDSLVIREGWLFRNVRRIEYRRIVNIDTERGILHRLLNVAEVRLESSTGGKPEGMMRVLGPDAVEELRERIFNERARTDATSTSGNERSESSPSTQLLHLPAGELLRYGLVDNRGMLIIAAFVGVLYQTRVIDRSMGILRRNHWDDWNDWIAWIGTGATAIALAVFGIVFLLIFTRLLSVAWALVTLHDFTLTQQATDLRVSYGLLTRVALTLRLQRIQAVHQTRSLLHRLFDRVSVAVDLAGDGFNPEPQGGNDRKKPLRWLAPLCTRDRAKEIIRAALPMLDHEAVPDWRPLSSRARGRIFRKTAMVLVLLLSIPSIAVGKFAFLLFTPLLIALAWWRAVTYTKHTRWALTRDALLFRSGWLTERLFIVPRNRIQSVRILVSPFDRRKHMGALVVDTAGASAITGPLRIAYLDFAIVSRLAQALYRFEGREWSEPAIPA